jgi:hypothetical protein
VHGGFVLGHNDARTTAAACGNLTPPARNNSTASLENHPVEVMNKGPVEGADLGVIEESVVRNADALNRYSVFDNVPVLRCNFVNAAEYFSVTYR